VRYELTVSLCATDDLSKHLFEKHTIFNYLQFFDSSAEKSRLFSANNLKKYNTLEILNNT
jgi:hypothetical protein